MVVGEIDASLIVMASYQAPSIRWAVTCSEHDGGSHVTPDGWSAPTPRHSSYRAPSRVPAVVRGAAREADATAAGTLAHSPGIPAGQVKPIWDSHTTTTSRAPACTPVNSMLHYPDLILEVVVVQAS